MKYLFLCYPKCSTCTKARDFLLKHKIDFEERNIKIENPRYEELKTWYKQSGLELKKFFNTSGLVYRQLDLKNKLKEMTEDEQLKLLGTDGMLVKRPVLISEKIIVGFDREKYEKLVK